MEDEDIKFSTEEFRRQLTKRISELEKAVATKLNDTVMAEKNLVLNQNLYAMLYLYVKPKPAGYCGGIPVIQ